ncbi:MAG TPA: dTDP-glucose 4,6-dehydratase [Terriglobales bacterium]|nr:dTDP-glucose 4,6-dehydratase [Terriglobales bacterium]
MRNCILVTGGAGFIGSNFVLQAVRESAGHVVNLDKLTYAGNLQNLESLQASSLHTFVCGDICDRDIVPSLLREHRPSAIVHFAAESHVDRSILGPEEFIRTNVNGTFTLLDCAKNYWRELRPEDKESFRFLHVSTDEVYGSLGASNPEFTEQTPFAPNSPYAASKAASDHLVRAYHHTYGLPTLTSNCSNNYGPFQFPEKLIPLTILNAMNGKAIPVYGDGNNVRDWLYVEDHCSAIATILRSGRAGETYNVGGSSEKTNIDVVTTICETLDELLPDSRFRPHASLIKYVTDRPGHDRRYAIDATKLRTELGWKPQQTFRTGIRKTVEWYLSHKPWLESVVSGAYKDWVAVQYARG